MTTQYPRCVVVGCGQWGGHLVRALSELKALAGIVEKNEIRALELSKTYHIPVISFSAALTLPDIQGIFIATPSGERERLAQDALNHQKHVFLEKPAVLREKEGRDLYQKALDQQRYLMAGHLLLYHPVFQKMKEMVKNGTLGEIRAIQTERHNFGKFFKNESVVWDFGPHDLSMILSLLPDDVDPMPLQILKTSLYERGGRADVFESTLIFSKCIKAHLSLSRLSLQKKQSISLIGSMGLLRFDDTKPWDEKLLYAPVSLNEEAPFDPPLRGVEKFIPISQEEPLKKECLAFLKAIQHSERPEGFKSALDVTRILEKLHELT